MARVKNEVSEKEMGQTVIAEPKEESIFVEEEQKQRVNPLKNTKVTVRHIFKKSGLFDNPKHVFAGGMAENAVKVFTVPRLRSGNYVNILTDAEKEFLEEVLGLPVNALSIYAKDNYWKNKMVRLGKHDNIFDLSDPEQYIEYKILLANKDFIAPSLQAMEDYPKSTYEFVIINEEDETKKAKQNMSVIQRCYKEFGKIEENKEILRTIVEILTGRISAPNTKLEWYQTKVNDLIQNDSKMFLKVVSDEYLETKTVIRIALEKGFIQKRNNLLYLNNEPLCEYGEESTINNAAKYLNNPAHQEILFSLQAKIK